MTLEPLLLASISLLGSGLLVALGRRAGLEHVALAVPTGLALLVAVSLLLVVLPVPYSAALALVVVALVVAASLWRTRAWRAEGTDTGAVGALVGPAVVWASVVAVGTLAIRGLRFTRVTADSYEYLQLGGVLEALGGPAEDAHLMVARQLFVGAAHAPSWLGNEAYLVALAPLLLVSAIAAVVWVVRVARSPARAERYEMALLVAAVAAVLTANRTWFHAFYVNAHLAVGVYLLLIAAIPWLIGRRVLPPRMALVPALGIVAVVVGRPEAPSLLLLLLLPIVLAPTIPRPVVAGLVGSFALSVVAWWAGAVRSVTEWTAASPATIALAVAAGVVGLHLLAVPSGRRRAMRSFLPQVVVGGLGVGALAVPVATGQVELLRSSVEATAANLAGAGLWGALPWTLPVLLVVVATVLRLGDGALFWVPLLGFVPLAFLLASARDGAYRVGPGDSLNRMWMHVLLLAVTALVLTLLHGEERPSRRDGPRSRTAWRGRRTTKLGLSPDHDRYAARNPSARRRRWTAPTSRPPEPT